MTRRFLNHNLRSERIQDFSTLPYDDHVPAFIIIQLVIIIIGNALKVTLPSTVSQIDFSVGTVEGLLTNLTIVQTHLYHGQFIWFIFVELLMIGSPRI